jgi:hypothetical protein
MDGHSQTLSFEAVRGHHSSVVVCDFAPLSKTADDFSLPGAPFQGQRWLPLLCPIPREELELRAKKSVELFKDSLLDYRP